MIKLFKKTKQKLLMKNSFNKYMIYAIGEIILVVIGILIALNINNWNEEQKHIRTAKEYIYDIGRDLKKDTTVFNSVGKTIDQHIQVKEWMLKQKDLSEIPFEYLNSSVGTSFFNIKVNNEAFNKMKNTNVLSLKEYKDLFQKINLYYTFFQNYLNNFNEWDAKKGGEESDFWEEQGIYEIELFDANDSIPVLQSKNERKKGITSLLTSIEGRNYLKLSLFRVKTMGDIYKKQSMRAEKLLEVIEETSIIE